VKSGSAPGLEGNGLRVLVAEDDASSRFRLQTALRSWGYAVTCVTDGRQAIAELSRADGPSLAVLDWSMPEADGLEVCRTLRSDPDGRYVYAILLTSHDRDEDVIAGFDAGADDYVPKPFRLGELLARVRALLRRAAPAELAARGVRVDPDARRAFRNGDEISLTPKEFDLLALLLANAGSVVRREGLMSQVWDENWFGSTKTLDVHMSSLRRKLGDDPDLITTVRGVGFRFET
jgi:DNA-binding response OmpR family regulator